MNGSSSVQGKGFYTVTIETHFTYCRVGLKFPKFFGFEKNDNYKFDSTFVTFGGSFNFSHIWRFHYHIMQF